MRIPFDYDRDWSSLGLYFTTSEVEHLRQKFDRFTAQHLIYCSFENRFAKSGGLAAVTVNILPHLKSSGCYENVLLMTPFYSRLMDGSKLQKTGVEFLVPFAEKQIPVELYKYRHEYQAPQPGCVDEYYVKADGFFEADNSLRNPYLYHPLDLDLNQKALLENSIFFCQAAPYALQALGFIRGIVLHLQEWQTALLALTSKEAMLSGVLDSCLSMITMHNPYDAFIPHASLQRLVPQQKREHITRFLYSGATSYQVGLALTDAAITTVSDTFATELTDDLIQVRHFAPHLQSLFKKNKVVGVNNGLFFDFSKKFPKREKHTLPELAEIKLNNRRRLLQILETYHPAEQFGELNYQRGPITSLPDDVPILVMSGRLDLMQKGYDVFLHCLEKFKSDEIKVILTPMPTRSADLDYFYEVACKCKGNITVFPMQMTQGFAELQAGSTFGLMPSIYEPFGAAIEYMANGTVTIARRTGGLVDQIEDGVNGFLFRESIDFYTGELIQAFMATPIVQLRKQNSWFEAMTTALYDCLQSAGAMYRRQPNDYYQMVQNGFGKAAQFGWNKSADKYIAVVRQAADLNAETKSMKIKSND